MLARQLLHRQLIAGFIIFRDFAPGGFSGWQRRQFAGLAQKGQLRAGTGQGLFVLIAFDGAPTRLLASVQFAAFGQAARENQRRSVFIVLRQQHLEYGFGIGKRPSLNSVCAASIGSAAAGQARPHGA